MCSTTAHVLDSLSTDMSPENTTSVMDVLKTIAALLKAGLVKRERGKNSLTTFGLIVYHTQEIIGKAVEQYWKLKAIDSIRASVNGGPQEQLHTIIDKLITNQEVFFLKKSKKSLLFMRLYPSLNRRKRLDNLIEINVTHIFTAPALSY